MQSITIDTNVLMSKPYVLSELIEEYEVIIPICVLEELDSINHKRNEKSSFEARRAIKEIFKLIEHKNLSFDNYYRRNKKIDNLIIRIAQKRKSMLMTFDINMTIKARAKK